MFYSRGFLFLGFDRHVFDIWRYYVNVTCSSFLKRRLAVHLIKVLFVCVLDDHSRVHLSSLEGVPDSDFINASFINVSDATSHGHR